MIIRYSKKNQDLFLIEFLGLDGFRMLTKHKSESFQIIRRVLGDKYTRMALKGLKNK